MTEEESTEKKRGCTFVIIRFGIFVVCLYVLQWVLQYALAAPETDTIAAALKPFQNHYLSTSHHFVTMEGASTEFSSDTTAVGRFLTLLIPAVMIWLVIVVPTYLIKPLEKYQGWIFWTVTVLVFGTLMYSEFFVPSRKTSFDKEEIVIRKTEWIFSQSTVRIPWSNVEKIDYRFLKDHDVHTGDLLYSQLFAVVSGELILLGENQLSPGNDALDATPEQIAEATAAVEVIEDIRH